MSLCSLKIMQEFSRALPERWNLLGWPIWSTRNIRKFEIHGFQRNDKPLFMASPCLINSLKNAHFQLSLVQVLLLQKSSVWTLLEGYLVKELVMQFAGQITAYRLNIFRFYTIWYIANSRIRKSERQLYWAIHKSEIKRLQKLFQTLATF